MNSGYAQILLFLIVGVIFTTITFAISHVLSVRKKTKEKQLPYECGEDVKTPAWIPFNFRFYVIALLFLIFDVELLLLIPWISYYKYVGFAGLAVGLVFLFLLGLGLLYEWKKGDLKWKMALHKQTSGKEIIDKE